MAEGRAVDVSTRIEEALRALDQYGVLLLSDPALPSLVGMIVGEPLRSSWWSHPLGSVIYHSMAAFEDDPGVLSTKLIGGKVTYVACRLWPAIVAIGTSREPWQLARLSSGARWLLTLTDAEIEIHTNDLAVQIKAQMPGRKRVPDLARELEQRILVHAAEIHTRTGAHAKVLQTWQRWAESVKLVTQMSAAAARSELEEAAQRLADAAPGNLARLPWRQGVAGAVRDVAELRETGQRRRRA